MTEKPPEGGSIHIIDGITYLVGRQGTRIKFVRWNGKIWDTHKGILASDDGKSYLRWRDDFYFKNYWLAYGYYRLLCQRHEAENGNAARSDT